MVLYFNFEFSNTIRIFYFIFITLVKKTMGKQITQHQLDELKRLKSLLTPTSTIDSKIGATVHIKQILRDLDISSSFSSSLSTELISFEIYREKYERMQTIISIVDNAIKYYGNN